MLVRHVALVNEKCKVKQSELTRVAAALQKQVARDFAPIWKVNATVDCFHDLDDVPVGYWPIVLMKDVEDAAGYHDNDEDGQPYALVEFAEDWPLTASHEALEMLADPYGRRLIAGKSPDPKQGRVAFLVEVCDPSEAAEYAYTVNGVLVSDFYTPDYFEPKKLPGQRYSFTGKIEGPREVLPGGYLSWRDPSTKAWYQLQRFTPKQKIVNLGAKQSAGSLRAWIDSKTGPLQRAAAVQRDKPQMQMYKAVRTESAKAAKASATSLRRQIRALVGKV